MAEMREKLEDFIKNVRIIDELMQPENKFIMAIGGSDTGKTTMIEHLVDILSKERSVGIVDLDMGQSHVGPPTTVTWGKVREGFGGWSRIVMEEFYFTGTVTPVGSLLPAIVGAKLMTERAASSCEKVVIDTSGLILGPSGRILKHSKIDILAPDIILTLQCSGELEHIMHPLRMLDIPKIYTLPVHPSIKSKSIQMRGRYRFEGMKSYFTNCGIREVPFNAAGIRYIREPHAKGIMQLKDRIISFRDRYNKDIALGIVEGISQKEELLMIRTPLKEDSVYSAIIIGKARIDMVNALLVDIPYQRLNSR